MFKTPIALWPRIPAYFYFTLPKPSSFGINTRFIQESWIGFINMSANLAGYFGNHNVGWLKAHGAKELERFPDNDILLSVN